MAFHPIDFDSFPRREHYLSFIGNNQCSYSMTVNVDITALGAHKLYPAMIWLLTRTVNEIPEFRMALVDGVLGVYDDMHPAQLLQCIHDAVCDGYHIGRFLAALQGNIDGFEG